MAGRKEEAKLLREIKSLQSELNSLLDTNKRTHDFIDNKLKSQTSYVKATVENQKASVSELQEALTLQKSINTTASAHSSLSDGVLDKLEKMKEPFESMKQKANEFKDTLQAIVSGLAPEIFIGAVVERSVAFGKAINDARVNMGLLGSQTLAVAKNIGVASIKGFALGVSFHEASEAAQAIVNVTGDINAATSDAIVNVAHMADFYGISAEQAAKLNKTTLEIADGSQQLADRTLESYKNLANANSVPLNRVLGEVADNTDFFARFSKEGGKNIAMASIQAAKLGTNLGTVEKITSSLLDLENSIESELEASVLLGRRLNFEKARQLIFAGDIAAAEQEIVSQLGTVSELQSMNVVQRDAIARSLGIEVSELQSMVANQEKLVTGAEEQMTLLDRAFEYAIGLGSSFKDNALLIGSIANLMNTGVVKGMVNLIGRTAGWLGQLVLGDKLAGRISGKFGAKAPRGSVGGQLKTFSGKGFGAGLLQAGAALTLFAGGMFIASKAFQGFAQVEWENIRNGTDVLLASVGVFLGLGALTTIFPALNAGLIGVSAAMALAGVGFLGFGKSLQMMNTVDFNKIGNGLLTMSKGMGSLALSSLALLPALPAIAALSAIGAVGNIVGGTAPPTETTAVVSNQDVINKLDELISVIKQGSTINLDGRKVGDALAMAMPARGMA